jgi:hypothetical protein
MKTFWLALAAASLAFAQKPVCSVAPGFSQQGEVRTFNTDTLFEYMNGNSEGYFLYGFQKMTGITCARGEEKLIFDVSEFSDPESAYGMFTGNLDPREPVLRLGTAGQVTPRKGVFVKDKYYVELAAEPEGDHAAVIRSALEAFEKTIAGSTARPVELGWFPKQGLKPGFPRLVPQSLLGLRMLSRGYLAQYEQGSAFVVTEASPEAAKELVGKLKERFQGGASLNVGEESFAGEDRYLGRVCVFRKGARVAGWAKLQANANAEEAAKSLAATLP